MKPYIRNLILSVVVPAVAASIAGCCASKSQSSKSETEARGGSFTTYQEGVPGSFSSSTHMVVATVTAIDRANRKVTLEGSDGQMTVVKLGPEVVNFDQIKVGDRVNATVTEEVIIRMTDQAAASSRTFVAAGAPKGEQPEGFTGEIVDVVATVTAIDQANHKATLRFPDGTTKTIAVRKDVDLSKRTVGERVLIRTTQAMAISVEKP